MRVPWRIVTSYPSAALRVYIKIAALAARGREGCTAGVQVLADWLGMSKTAVERALRVLTRPDDQGVTEVVTERRTLPGGRGTTARRHVRPAEPGERWVWLPVAAADVLPGRLMSIYAALTYATARSLPITEAEIGRVAGVTARTASAAMDELEALGWITLTRRAGHQGRHLATVHTYPLHLVPGPEVRDGSGPEVRDGSLAIEEDQRTDRPVTRAAVGGDIRRRRPTGSPGAPVDNRTARRRTPAAPPGPGVMLAPRTWHILTPVHDLLPDISPYLLLRRIEADITRQITAYATPDRLQHRLTVRRAQLTTPMRDPGRWLLGAGLPRWGCGLTSCETGVLWHTGARCEVCRELAADRHALRTASASPEPPLPPPQRPTAPRPQQRPVWHECDDCRAPSRTPLTDGLCAACRTTPAPLTPPAPPWRIA